MTSARPGPDCNLPRNTNTNRYFLPSSDHLYTTISVDPFVDLYLIQVIEENVALSLSAEDIDLLVDGAAGVGVSRSGNVTDLLATVPSEVNFAVDVHGLLGAAGSSACIFVHHL